ncbi:phosphocholine cytidylyltransferase family protein [bacterium]|nr:phosphocholine cytidylyltransferase family protein [bacterium]
MKGIIIAAGKGVRLKGLTNDQPKCLLTIGGKSILQHQLDVYRNNGIKNISIIKGYCAEKIDLEGITYFFNDDYSNNNILLSLMYAESQMDGEFIATYSDIVYESSVLSAILESDADISIITDVNWQKSYEGRTEHPLDEAEKVIFNENHIVKKIGKDLGGDSETPSEFIGMIKCTEKGAQIFKEYFYRAKTEFDGRPFGKAKEFKKAYLTDLLQYITDQSIPVKCVPIEGCWTEIDTPQDIERANALFQKRT